jgi:hypothetical protein
MLNVARVTPPLTSSNTICIEWNHSYLLVSMTRWRLPAYYVAVQSSRALFAGRTQLCHGKFKFVSDATDPKLLTAVF